MTASPTPALLRRLVIAVLCVGLATIAAAADLEAPFVPHWRGADDQPLPFETDAQILDFLRRADVVGKKVLTSGITRPYKLTLELDGVRAHAIFRTVNENPPAGAGLQVPRGTDRPRDCYLFEVAAYEIARLLGLEKVPPVVVRTIDGEIGSLQLWVEAARTEASRMEADEPPPNPASWHLQRQLMTAFDTLIDNRDRHEGNVLIDDSGNLWFIDHTRAFQRVPSVIDRITMSERGFFERLRDLDPALIKRRLHPYLQANEIAALLARRKQLIRRVEKLIEERGEGAVLYDIART